MVDTTPSIEALWDRYAGMVLRRCRRLLRDEDEALEASQDVFVQLLRRGDRLRIRYPSSFLYQTATNLCLNRIRDRRASMVALEDASVAEIARMEEISGVAEARSVLHRLFARHQPSSRLIAVLHFVDGLTLNQVAREVGMSVSGVRKRLSALRQTLRETEAA
jgi:RNA polymerase sigma factor (sigma-70 family)